MTDTALAVTDNGDMALQHFGARGEVRELGDRLMKMHPAASEVGEPGMRAVAQLALMLGANPLPGANEIHVWKGNRGTQMSLGINYWRRKAEEWGGVLYAISPRLMRPDEAATYGIAGGIIAAICRGVRTDDMIRFKRLGFGAVDIYDMCGRVGIGIVNAGETAKSGRPLSWTALKRAETDMLRQLFPVQFGEVERHGALDDAPVVVSADDEPGAGVAQRSHVPYTLADANRDLFGDDSPPVTRRAEEPEDGVIEDAAPQEPPPPPPAQPPASANGNGGNGQPQDAGPLPDDELTIEEAPAAQFVPVAAGLLETDEATLKKRMKALGYNGVSGKPAERVAAYRALKADLGHADDLMAVAEQPALVTVDDRRPGSEYQE